MNIIKNRHIFLTISVILILSSVVSIAVFGLRQGVDFAGGTLWQIQVPEGVTKNDIAAAIGKGEIITQPDNKFLIKMRTLSENEHQHFLSKLEDKVGKVEELRFESIGPVIGRELRSRAVWAFVLVLIAVSLYIAFAFRKVSKPISSWTYGLVTLAALFHDVIISIGLMAVLGVVLKAEIDTNFIVAILVVMGYSVNDTIVVFDRVREKLASEEGKKMRFDDLVNQSINETIGRSVNTSFTLIIVLLAMLLFGAQSLLVFSLIIAAGVIAGTYSSIFIASPLLTIIAKR